MSTAHSLPPNRLAGETSPYLLQHAHNPVDWYPWSDEAFARAKAEVIEDMAVLEERLRDIKPTTKVRAKQPDLHDVLARLDGMAAEYSALCASAAS